MFSRQSEQTGEVVSDILSHGAYASMLLLLYYETKKQVYELCCILHGPFLNIVLYNSSQNHTKGL